MQHNTLCVMPNQQPTLESVASYGSVYTAVGCATTSVSLLDLTGGLVVRMFRGWLTGHDCRMLSSVCMLRIRLTRHHCMMVNTGCTLTERSGMQVAAGYVLHIGQADGAFTVGDKVVCQRDQQRRQRILPNHTFTHVLNYALREVLGDAVHQKGSIVLPDKLR